MLTSPYIALRADDSQGDPSLADTAFGPLADKKQFERVMSFLTGAREEGVQVLVGGERKGDKGTFVNHAQIRDRVRY